MMGWIAVRVGALPFILDAECKCRLTTHESNEMFLRKQHSNFIMHLRPVQSGEWIVKAVDKSLTVQSLKRNDFEVVLKVWGKPENINELKREWQQQLNSQKKKKEIDSPLNGEEIYRYTTIRVPSSEAKYIEELFNREKFDRNAIHLDWSIDHTNYKTTTFSIVLWGDTNQVSLWICALNELSAHYNYNTDTKDEFVLF